MKPFLILVLLISTSLSFAQHEFLGQVNSSEGSLPYTNIAVKHSNKGTVSDEDGQFRIKLKSTDTLLVSHLGYGTKEVAINNLRNLEIVLDDFETLTEVVINGYSSKSKSCQLLCYRTGCGVSSETINYDVEVALIDVVLFPNPSKTGVFRVTMPNEFSELQVIVASLSGQVISKNNFELLEPSFLVDLSAQPAGIYLISIFQDGHRLASKKAIVI
ncbi:carboxypeptidase-like regulatory domain-containing protein [Sediminibacter sp. Hel_I_10]|uniref:carboxypeptidase-like regulatory domain-containing protein n=1 Tax=Sediminibacter sp. Hel_I_10 TaxID=1392490 RepID=UPI00047D5DF3|nr:carboxypeptidase-like regulatory domain-containing protein [Sediminibacter sp. Hel_I_10]